MKPTHLVLALAALSMGSAQAALTLTSSSMDESWTVVPYENGEPVIDQQTGQSEADLVSDTTNPFFLTQFDDGGTESLTDGTLAFRFRLGSDQGSAGYNGALFAGIDATGDGSLDLFVGVNFSGADANKKVGIWRPTGPITTNDSLKSQGFGDFLGGSALDTNGVDYDWRAITTADVPDGAPLDLDGQSKGAVDYYLSFAIDFATLVSTLGDLGITVDQNTALRYVVGTSEQGNSFNQDLGGVGAGYDGSLPWSDIGATSDPITADGTAPSAVPEPAGTMMAALGGALLMMRRQRRS
ncbi:hypothetical protein [Sulfuriroseicoccus oceanibius]|uniref:PEP-CTERM protein-sorting domain-containing protein n=1 Tax=Sulfuriroseicoccus oceanibius TaxID=2707525 RepID=A0A6B3LDK4_9BACT|nr:hypothetical protein [Sulfuriroseicoccus oceanibius]QQL45016.1 hypothetical protein G3M56_000050 [Sulfuriroseicoccus oceanibius]